MTDHQLRSTPPEPAPPEPGAPPAYAARPASAGSRSAGNGPAPEPERRTAAVHCRHAMSYAD
ncbi:hypothetical protein [Kitasatospora sp. NPDC047058]|uniref:hypothetical protein n=1 Tax=Kitasatospora sp. NPDC047058 TaxID=3155620 RepID=UPI0033EFCFBD